MSTSPAGLCFLFNPSWISWIGYPISLSALYLDNSFSDEDTVLNHFKSQIFNTAAQIWVFEKLQVALFPYLLLCSVPWISEDNWLASSSKESCWYIMIVMLSLVMKWSLLISAVSWADPHVLSNTECSQRKSNLCKGNCLGVTMSLPISPCSSNFQLFHIHASVPLQPDVNIPSFFLLLFNFYFFLFPWCSFTFFLTKYSVNKGEMGCVHGYD